MSRSAARATAPSSSPTTRASSAPSFRPSRASASPRSKGSARCRASRRRKRVATRRRRWHRQRERLGQRRKRCRSRRVSIVISGCSLARSMAGFLLCPHARYTEFRMPESLARHPGKGWKNSGCRARDCVRRANEWFCRAGSGRFRRPSRQATAHQRTT